MSDRFSGQDEAWQALFRAYMQCRSALDERLKSADLPGLEMLSVLRLLAEGSTDWTAKQLEDHLLVPQYAVSRLLDRMEEDGLISRRTASDDHRRKQVEITKKGMALMAKARDAYSDGLDAFWSARARPGQVSRIARLLKILDLDTL